MKAIGKKCLFVILGIAVVWCGVFGGILANAQNKDVTGKMAFVRLQRGAEFDFPHFKGAEFIEEKGGSVSLVIRDGFETFRLWDNEGHTLTWKFAVPEKGSYYLVIRYTLGVEEAYRDIKMNGTYLVPEMARVYFPSTRDWHVSDVAALCDENGEFIVLDLDEGEYVVSMEALTFGGLNLISFALIPSDVSLKKAATFAIFQ